jgi:hypothetical protein
VTLSGLGRFFVAAILLSSTCTLSLEIKYPKYSTLTCWNAHLEYILKNYWLCKILKTTLKCSKYTFHDCISKYYKKTQE